MVTKLEEYTGKAADSLAAAEGATTERDRLFHRRAHTIWRRLIAGVGEAEERAALKESAPAKPVRPTVKASTAPGRKP